MIKSITVTNYLGESIKMELARPEKSGFIVYNISGLGPGKAYINTTEVSTDDGGLFNSARLPSRNIVIGLKYMWKDTIEEARHRSYKYFPLKKKVKLLIETDTRIAEIEGYVDSNEPNIFGKTQCSDISIICPNPYFYSVEGAQSGVVFSGTEPAFEFPFSNESLTDGLLEMSITRNTIEQVVTYTGDAEIGVTITINAIGPATNITIYNTGTREVMRVDTSKLEAFTGAPLGSGDQITICTVKKRKSITLLRAGKTTNILNCLDRNPDWFSLAKGDNVFAYTAESGGNNLQFKINHQVIYEGV